MLSKSWGADTELAGSYSETGDRVSHRSGGPRSSSPSTTTSLSASPKTTPSPCWSRPEPTQGRLALGTSLPRTRLFRIARGPRALTPTATASRFVTLSREGASVSPARQSRRGSAGPEGLRAAPWEPAERSNFLCYPARDRTSAPRPFAEPPAHVPAKRGTRPETQPTAPPQQQQPLGIDRVEWGLPAFRVHLNAADV